MTPPTRRARGARPRARRAAALVGVAMLLAACSGASYDGISEEAEVPRLTTTATTEPATTAPPTTPPATTPPPTNPATTAPAAPATTAPPGAAPAAPPTTTRATVALGGTGVRMEVPTGWQVAPNDDVRSLLPVLAPALTPSGLLDTTRLVVTRPSADTRGVEPSVVAFERPRAGGDTAIGVLRALRGLVGRSAAASEPAREPSRVGDGAYVTYQWTATVDGTAVQLVSEHYAFVRPGSVLVLAMTTTTDRTATDGRTFGRVLSSLTADG